MERTCGPWVRDILRKLGMQEQEEIQSALVERQIRQAQAKVSRQVESFELADSAEEWVERNLPPRT
jgi:arginine repressor